MSSTTLAIAVSPTRVRSRLAWRVPLAFAGSWLVAGLAQIEIKLPFTPVPITGQTLGVLLIGASLGAGLGAASMLLYLAQGALGLPFFSGGDSGAEFLRELVLWRVAEWPVSWETRPSTGEFSSNVGWLNPIGTTCKAPIARDI